MRFALLSLLLLCLLTAAAQKRQSSSLAFSSNTKTAAAFDNYITNALALWKTPGLSVVVVRDNKVVFQKAYGVADIETGKPFTTATIASCASTTKAMTAVCVAMLVDEGKLKWTDRVADILPEFKLSDPYTTTQVTVLDLLTHRAGFASPDLLTTLGYPEQEIVRRLQFVPQAYSLRSSFIYNNSMYTVAGEVIRKVSGMAWKDFMRERLFTPLGMTRTFADSSFTRQEDRISAHFMRGDTAKKINTSYYGYGPSGAVWSCADDIGKWLRFLLDSARVNGKPLLRPQTYGELFRPHVIVPDSQYDPTYTWTKPHWKTYGLGWFQQDYRGEMIQLHTGSISGSIAMAGLLPDQRFGFYVFGNLDHSEIRHALLFKSFDLWCFGDPTQDWSTRFYTLYRETYEKRDQDRVVKAIPGTVPSLPLAAYTGTYSSPVFGEAEVVLENGGLILKYSNNFVRRLQHLHYDVFTALSPDWWQRSGTIQFQLDGEGKIKSFTVNNSSPYTKKQ